MMSCHVVSCRVQICCLYLETLCPAETHDDPSLTLKLRALLCPVKATPSDLTLLPQETSSSSSSSLLSSHVPVSDKEALDLSNSLLRHGGDSLLSEAQSVLVTRGLHWLLPQPHQHQHQHQQQGEEEEGRGNEAKALFFFTQAQAHGRATALLDASLTRCVVAFCRHVSGSGGGGGGERGLSASLWSLDGLAIDYRRVSDIHSTTSRLYVSRMGWDGVRGGLALFHCAHSSVVCRS